MVRVSTSIACFLISVILAIRSIGAFFAGMSIFGAAETFAGSCLTVPSKMVWPSTSVAGREPAISSRRRTKSIGPIDHSSRSSCFLALSCNMVQSTTVVASLLLSIDTQGRTICSNVTFALTVVALLCFSRSGHRTGIALVSRSLAVVAKSLWRLAGFGEMTEISTFIAGFSLERHGFWLQQGIDGQTPSTRQRLRLQHTGF